MLQHSEEEEDAVNRDERQDDSLLGVLGDELEALALDTGLIELLCSQNENTSFGHFPTLVRSQLYCSRGRLNGCGD